jgi:hypothetical protein
MLHSRVDPTAVTGTTIWLRADLKGVHVQFKASIGIEYSHITGATADVTSVKYPGVRARDRYLFCCVGEAVFGLKSDL